MTLLSKKYRYLAQAEKAGIVTPKTLLLDNTDQADIQHFISECGTDKRFIVRSMQSAEDNHQLSYAGHFYSSSALKADEVVTAIALAQSENQQRLQQLGLDELPQLMLQEYIEHSIGGVLFSPWSFFSHYCFIEYSTRSVQEAVEGKTKPAIISLKEQALSPLPLLKSLDFLDDPLRTLSQQLQKQFNFPIDSEWVYCEKKQSIVLLQVRPQTHLVGALFNATPAMQQQLKLADGVWQYSALSESLGKLSPLSFSLLQQLYDEARGGLQSLGYQAKQVDFMVRLPDGTILSDPQREKRFYQATRFGGFWNSFKAPQWQQKIKQLLNTVTLDNAFSYTQLSLYFQYWLVANVLSKGEGREENTVHAYELSWQQHLAPPVFNHSDNSWGVFNRQLKQLFFFELEKLKQQVANTPEKVLLSWNEYQSNKILSDAVEQDMAKKALYDYSLLGADLTDGEMQAVGAKKASSGKLFIIENPSLFQQEIPAGVILIAPYFDNRWVQKISQLKAIIVTQGGYLSHSAIVAREAGVPYFVGSLESLGNFHHGDRVELSLTGGIKASDSL